MQEAESGKFSVRDSSSVGHVKTTDLDVSSSSWLFLQTMPRWLGMPEKASHCPM